MFVRKLMRTGIAVGLVIGIMTWAITASFAETIRLEASLVSSSVVPPNSSQGKGQGRFTYNTDTKQLTYTVTYNALIGAATSAHIHGPAVSGVNAPVIVTFFVPDSPISGTATLTQSEADALLAGQLYVDVHTDANGAGEIRGQIVK